MKKAIIFGITGQDGSFLAEFLIKKNYEVHGVIRRSSSNNLDRLKNINDNKNLIFHYGDLVDSNSIFNVISEVMPDEIYNLASQSDVKVSFDTPLYTSDVNALGTLRILDAIRLLKLENKTKFYQASTSELFGKVEEIPQSETTIFHPYSPYGIAKQYAYWITKEYREAYNIYAVNGILFNHESERRGEEFVTRKITLAAAKIKLGLQDHLELGNMDSLRDWGYAKDYVESMWLMLNQDVPDDYVIATGEQHTVREFVIKAFKENEIDIEFKGVGIHEKGYDKKTKKLVVKVNPKYYRPTDVNNLLGNPSKAIEKLGWNPKKTSFDELVKIMCKHDYELVKESLK